VTEFQDINSQLLAEVKASNLTVANNLTQQADQLGLRLEQAAKALDTRIATLEQCASQVSEIAKLQQNLEQTVHSLEQTAQLEHVLVGVRESLTQLTPILEQLNRPRRITLVERDDRSLDFHA
jgi:chromosome segregation ATPase